MSSEAETSLILDRGFPARGRSSVDSSPRPTPPFCPRPFLQLRFAPDGVLHVIVVLVVEQLVTPVGRREPLDFAGPMLAHAPPYIIRHANVEHGIVRVRDDVNPEVVIARHQE